MASLRERLKGLNSPYLISVSQRNTTSPKIHYHKYYFWNWRKPLIWIKAVFFGVLKMPVCLLKGKLKTLLWKTFPEIVPDAAIFRSDQIENIVVKVLWAQMWRSLHRLWRCHNQIRSDWEYCVTRAPLLYFIRSWVALSFKVCEWVRHR